MRSTVSTVVAAFAALAVVVFGAHAWGQPEANSLNVTSSSASPSPGATEPLATQVPTPVADTNDSGPEAAADGEGTATPATASQVVGVPSGDGYLVAPGTGPYFGQEGAPLWLYSVEVEPSLSGELGTLVSATDAALGDATRGWTAQGQRSLQRTDDPQSASIRIVLAPPGEVDRQCATAGLDTVGYYSCWDGWHTMLNSDRWFGATPDFSDLNVYRTYLVNHEVGHGLGYNHEFCTVAGAPAPVMMQQSMGIGQCLANGWPFPQ